jgi:hypothetical protein
MHDDIADLVDRVRAEARSALEGLRRRTSEEIHGYPSPIAGCDAQFNHLLERRTGIVGELQRLTQLGEGRASARELDAFLASSLYLDQETRQALRDRLRPALARALEPQPASHR